MLILTSNRGAGGKVQKTPITGDAALQMPMVAIYVPDVETQ